MGSASIRKYLSGDEIHTMAGTIVVPQGESSHFFVNAEKNVVVHVQTHHHAAVVQANLSNGPGVWSVPDPGTEVLLGTDMGNYEGELYVVGTYGHTNVANAATPGSLSSQQHNVVVTGDINLIVAPGSTIRLASSLSSGEALALQSELHAIWSYLRKQFDPAAGHSHKVIVPAQPTLLVEGLTEGTPGSVALTAIEPDGTQIVKGE